MQYGTSTTSIAATDSGLQLYTSNGIGITGTTSIVLASSGGANQLSMLPGGISLTTPLFTVYTSTPKMNYVLTSTDALGTIEYSSKSRWNAVTVSVSYTVPPEMDVVVYTGTHANDVIALPEASSALDGKIFIVTNMSGIETIIVSYNSMSFDLLTGVTVKLICIDSLYYNIT